MLEVLLLETAISRMEFVHEVEGLLQKLSDYELPVNTKLKLFQYFDQTDRYARAADLLFEMLETGNPDRDILARGIAFYQRLKRKNDAALSAGDFSRVEAEEGLARLLDFNPSQHPFPITFLCLPLPYS